jgi:hypothetical protein
LGFAHAALKGGSPQRQVHIIPALSGRFVSPRFANKSVCVNYGFDNDEMKLLIS